MRKKEERKEGEMGRRAREESEKKETDTEPDRQTYSSYIPPKYISLSCLFSLWLPQKHSKDFNARPRTILT